MSGSGWLVYTSGIVYGELVLSVYMPRKICSEANSQERVSMRQLLLVVRFLEGKHGNTSNLIALQTEAGVSMKNVNV